MDRLIVITGIKMILIDTGEIDDDQGQCRKCRESLPHIDQVEWIEIDNGHHQQCSDGDQ